MMKRLLIASVVFVMLLVGGASASTAGWFQGDSDASVYEPAGTKDLEIHAAQDINLLAQHLRFGGKDGNFEFESNTGRSLLLAYTIGSATRLPIVIGGNNGTAQPNFVGLQLDANAGQTVDVLQVRDANGTVMAGVKPSGDVRAPSVTLGGIKLTLAYQGSTLCLVATLPDGTTRRVALR